MTNELIIPSQNHYMRSKVLSKLVRHNGIGAEIGVHKGEFIRPILESVNPARLHLIDPWYLFGLQWPWATGNKSTTDAFCNIVNQFSVELSQGVLVLNIGYDQEMLLAFTDYYFDWVYLDTSHRYEDTKIELKILSQKAKKDGVIVGDDWYENPSNLHHGVYRAVNEFVLEQPYQLIYANNYDKQWAIRRY